MKTKTLICSGFLWLAIGCSSNSSEDGSMLPKYQNALTACKASTCSMLQPTDTQCDKIRADLIAPNGGAYGKSPACADAQAAVVITCLLPYCDSPTKNCESKYLSQIAEICQ